MADLQAFAKALAADTGLTYQAALAWTTAEVGNLNNLGIMQSPGVPKGYATPQQGAAAAAQLINTSSNYAGIRASVGGTAQQQMDAIARSPWHLGPSGLKAAGGLDPYYTRIFKQFGYNPSSGGGYSGGSSSGGSGSGASTPTAGQSAVTSALDKLQGGDAGGIASNLSNLIDLTTPAYFIGVMLVSVVFILIGGIIILKPKMPSVMPIPV